MVSSTPGGPEQAVILSFDVEEHYRIEAAVGLEFPDDVKRVYADRMAVTTRRLLARLAALDVTATFFIVGQIAETDAKLVKEIAAAGHEVGSHGWDHRRVHRFTPETFHQDIRRSKDALEQVTGTPVAGYRAPTFSVVRETGWAIDVLAENGLTYDSSIFPVRHDRYGILQAPRAPFLAEGNSAAILELPPATYRVLGQNLPVAGGGYFRLFPLGVMRAGISQLVRRTVPPVGMLYFHPWEFDPGQPKLPLKRLSRWRTYVGVGRSEARLGRLLSSGYRFRRAVDVANDLLGDRDRLARFRVPALQPG